MKLEKSGRAKIDKQSAAKKIFTQKRIWDNSLE